MIRIDAGLETHYWTPEMNNFLFLDDWLAEGYRDIAGEWNIAKSEREFTQGGPRDRISASIVAYGGTAASHSIGGCQ